MAIFIDETTKFIIQGITGKEGQRAATFMQASGSQVIGGVRPGKAGEEVEGVKVFDTVKDALASEDLNDPRGNEALPRSYNHCSVIAVPPKFVKEAVTEAIDAGVKLLVPIAEGVPVQDSAWIQAYAQKHAVRIIGPNTAGLISPGKSMAGLMGGRGKAAYTPGPVGIISKSGGMTGETARLLSAAGLGQSTCICIGGDKISGTSIKDCLEAFAEDKETKAVVIFGEIGGSYEEEAAEYIKSSGFSKPVVAFITGQFAQRFPSIPLGHAGAIIEGNKGTRRSKVEALEGAGVSVVDVHHEIVEAVQKVLN